MTEPDFEPSINDDVARHLAKKQDVRRAWFYAMILGVALAAISVLATLLWVNSQNNVNKLATSNDSQINQFNYCQKALKTDPKCQQPVAQPAEKVVSGPQGIPGVQGNEGPMGPEGPQGPQGIQGVPGKPGTPGQTPACWLDATRCVGASGVTGKSGKDGATGAAGLNGKDGVNGKDGLNGLDGKDGINGKDGVDGKDGADGKDGKDGAPGPAGMECPTGYTAQQVEVMTGAVPPANATLWACVLGNP
jgi:hypothetical protein